MYLCKLVGGSVEVSREGEAARYWPIDAVHEWHKNHDRQVEDARDRWCDVA